MEMIENSNTTKNNTNGICQSTYNPNNTPLCYSTGVNGQHVNNGVYKTQCASTNGYSTRDQLYINHEVNGNNNEVAKGRIDYTLADRNFHILAKNNKQYANLQNAYFSGNGMLYNQLYGGYMAAKPGPQNNLGEQPMKAMQQAYDGVYGYDTLYSQQYPVYNAYTNYKSNKNKDEDYDYVPESESSSEYMSPKDASSGGDCSTADPSAKEQGKEDATEDNSPFGNLLPKRQTEGENEGTDETVATENTTSIVKCSGYNNYYYTEEPHQVQNNICQNTYQQQMYNHADVPIDGALYNWQWPIYKMPQNIYMPFNNRYQNIYNPGIMYNKLLNDKWNTLDGKNKEYKTSIKRGKNSSAGRPRLNRSDYACSKCRARVTPQWRYLNGVAVCNACYMRARKEKMTQSRN